MADAVTTIGWDNSEAQAGAQQYANILSNAANRTRELFNGIKPALEGALAGAAALSAGIFKEGFEFNFSLGDAEVGIANVLAKFQGLNKEAAKLEAAKAIAAIKKIEPEAAGGLNDLIQGFLATAASAQSAGVNVQQNVELVGMFANALANAAIPAEQLSQEMRSIFTGNIGQDSTLAKILQITNAQVEAAKSSGNLYGYLKDKIGELGVAGDTATVTISSLKSAFAELSGALTQLPFKTAIDGAKELTQTLKDIKDATEQTSFRLSGDGIKDVYSALADERPARAIALLEGKIAEVRGRIRDVREGGGVSGAIQKGMSHASGEINGLLLLLNEYKSLVVRIRRDEEEFIKTAQAARDAEAGRANDAKRKSEDEARAKVKALSDAEKLRREDARSEDVRKLKPDLQSARDETLSIQLNSLEKLEIAKQRLLDIEKRLSEARRQQAPADSIIRIEIEREQALQRVLGLEQSINAEKEDQKKKSEQDKKEAFDKATKQSESVAQLAKEMEILKAKANGRFKEAEALQKQLDISKEAARIQEETGKSAKEALVIAQERADLAEKAARRESKRGDEERRIKGFTQDRNRFTNPFRGLDARNESLRNRTFGARDVNAPGLSAFERLQDRKNNPIGAAFKKVDKNLLADKAAANNRGPVDNGALAALGRIEQGINNLTQTFAEAAGV